MFSAMSISLCDVVAIAINISSSLLLSGDLLLEQHKLQSADDDAVTLKRAAQIVRREIMKIKYDFDGSLIDEQYDIQPTALVALVQMIIGDTIIKNQVANDKDTSLAASSLTELIVFNTVKNERKKDAKHVRHNTE